MNQRNLRKTNWHDTKGPRCVHLQNSSATSCLKEMAAISKPHHLRTLSHARGTQKPAGNPHALFFLNLCMNRRTTPTVSIVWWLYIVTRIASEGIPNGCERMSSQPRSSFASVRNFSTNSPSLPRPLPMVKTTCIRERSCCPCQRRCGKNRRNGQ